MGMETTGKLHTIFETKQVSERFTKREFVVELADNPKYPQVVLFQVTGDRCAQLDGLRVGDAVRVEFSLRGREWRSPQGDVKYFNSLDAWKVEPASQRQGRGQGAPAGYDDDGRGRGGGRGGYEDEGRGRGTGGRGGYDGGRGRGQSTSGGADGRQGNAPVYPGFDDDAVPRTDEPRPRDEMGRDGDDLPF